MSSAPTVQGRGAAVTVAAQAAARAATIVVVLGSTAIIARELSTPHFADWVTVLSLMALSGTLIDPSLTPVVVRRLLQDPAGSPTPRTMALLRVALAAAAVVLVVGLTVLARGTDAAVLAAVIAVQLLPRALIINAGGYLQVDQRLHRQTAFEAVAAVLAITGLAVAAALDASPAVLGLAAYPLPTTLLAVVMVRELRRTPSTRIPPPGDDHDRVRSLVREAAPLGIALILGTIYLRVDVLFVNAADATVRAVAGYLFAFQFAEQMVVFGTIIASAVLPLFAVRETRKLLDDARVHDVLLALVAVGATGSLIAIAISGPFVDLIGGDGLAPARRSLILLAPQAAVMLWAVPLGAIYVSEGRGRAYLTFNVVALAVNVVGNAALTLPLGVDPAARLTWFTELIVVALAARPLARGAANRQAGLRLAGLVAVAIAASEAAAAGLPALAVAVVAGPAVPALAGGPLRRVARSALAR